MKNTNSGSDAARHDVSRLSKDDLYLFNEGRNYRAYNQLGAHPATHEGEPGTLFGVWAPNARSVNVVGNFNDWNPRSHELQPRGSSGIWEGFIPRVGKGDLSSTTSSPNITGMWRTKPTRSGSITKSRLGPRQLSGTL